MPGSWHDKPPTSPYQAYLEESRKPITCLVFTLPFFILYHAGVWAIREIGNLPWVNGADLLLAMLMNLLGLGGPLISMFLVVIVFLLLQQASGRSWRFSWRTLALMGGESLIFALPPFFLAALVSRVILSVVTGGEPTWLVNLILSLGAGIYEEFVFRMLIFTGLLGLLGRLGKMKGAKLFAWALFIQALLFALFHHLPGSGEPLRLGPFAFRTLAGIYFGYLYYERGFGIAAGSHAFYDIIAVMLKTFR